MYKLKVGLFLGPEHEIMVFITPPIYKFVHKQNIGDFLFIVVLLNQRKKTSFYQISVLSILIFFKKTYRHYRTVKMHLYKLYVMIFYEKDDAWKEAYRTSFMSVVTV